MKIAEQIFTILSDDVRQEVGNKNSIMGIYSDRMVFQELPALLPKLILTVFLIDLKTAIMPDATGEPTFRTFQALLGAFIFNSSSMVSGTDTAGT